MIESQASQNFGFFQTFSVQEVFQNLKAEKDVSENFFSELLNKKKLQVIDTK